VTDKDEYPGVYVDETEPGKQIDGVATSGSGQLPEGSPGTSIPGVPTTASPQPPKALPIDRSSPDDRTEEPVRVSEETAG
jgi:hypothetical protein